MEPFDRQARIRHLEAELRELRTSGGKEVDEMLRGGATERAAAGSDTVDGAFRQYNQRQRAANDFLFRPRRAKRAPAE